MKRGWRGNELPRRRIPKRENSRRNERETRRKERLGYFHTLVYVWVFVCMACIGLGRSAIIGVTSVYDVIIPTGLGLF